MLINKTELEVKASVLEEGLVDEVVEMIKENPRLFDDEKVVLMADTHKGNGVPVGFTMTLKNGLVPVDYVSADMFCGVSAYLIKGFVPYKDDLVRLSYIVRDIISVNRRVKSDNTLTDLGTLGNGNHFVEIGTNGLDTLISVHSGSRNFGGEMFKKHKNIAIEHTREHYAKERKEALVNIEPKLRQAYLKSLPKVSDLPLLDVNKYNRYFVDLEEAREFAQLNRKFILDTILFYLDKENYNIKAEFIESVHNYIDTSCETPILRKGSIQAKKGEKVIIPINMKDGTIIGVCSLTDKVNYSLPHGAGRVMSRTRAFNELDLKQFKDDMKNVISSTVVQDTLDESPRAYKELKTILNDIEPYLSSYEIFKPLFNYKGV